MPWDRTLREFLNQKSQINLILSGRNHILPNSNIIYFIYKMIKEKYVLNFKNKRIFCYIHLMVCNWLEPKMLCFCFSNLFGRVAVVKEGHSENAQFPIVVTLLGMVIEIREEQEWNALSPTVVMPFGMETHFKEEQERNANSPIVVIPSFITTFLICFLFEDQGVVGASSSLFHS